MSTHSAATFLHDTWPQLLVMVVVLALLRPLAVLCQVVTINLKVVKALDERLCRAKSQHAEGDRTAFCLLLNFGR